MFKILHTADWHLGQKFCDRDRREEHQHFLDWLIGVLTDQPIDALLVAGDVFDSAMPPNYALQQYYNFLYQATHIRPDLHIIITGGNHDFTLYPQCTPRIVALAQGSRHWRGLRRLPRRVDTHYAQQ